MCFLFFGCYVFFLDAMFFHFGVDVMLCYFFTLEFKPWFGYIKMFLLCFFFFILEFKIWFGYIQFQMLMLYIVLL